MNPILFFSNLADALLEDDEVLEQLANAENIKDVYAILKANDYVNFDDLNRVENNTQWVADKLIEYNYYFKPIVTKTDWNMQDIVYFNDLNRIENNIKTLQEAYYVSDDFKTPKTDWKTLDPVDFNFNNRIEKDIDIINNLIDSMSKYFIHCGVCNAGQDRVWQNRFRRY